MYDRILVPVDGSPTSEAGLTEAIRLAHLSGGRICLMYLVDEMPFVPEAASCSAMVPNTVAAARDRGAAMLDRWGARVVQAGVEVDTKLLEGIGSRLVEFVNEQVQAWKADIVVLGTHGRHGLGRALIGSDAEQIVRHATVPVLLVHGVPRPEAALPIARTAEGTAS
jgi:nucleotide-binding universal stress UspA family protein